MKNIEIKSNKNCIWEDYPVGIIKNYKLDEYDTPCKHVIKGVLKLVIVGTNEGGYNSVGMCGKCLKELLKENGL